MVILAKYFKPLLVHFGGAMPLPLQSLGTVPTTFCQLRSFSILIPYQEVTDSPDMATYLFVVLGMARVTTNK